MMRTEIGALALCMVLAGCAQPGAETKTPAVDIGEAETKVKLAEADLASAYAAKDAKRVQGHYAADAKLLVPFQAPRKGEDVIKDFEDPRFRLGMATQGVEVAASGDMAYSHGTFEVEYTDTATKRLATLKGNYLTVYRKGEDGSWKIVADAATPGAP